MALTKKGGYYFGDSQADIRKELARYSKLNEYLTDHFVDSLCACGSSHFQFYSDDDEGVAARKCVKCGVEHVMADGSDYLDEAMLGNCECVCEKNTFEITSGVHLYRTDDDELSDDVRWLYIGCRCVSCGLVGCYSDWKSEFSGYKKLLEMM